VSSHAPGTPGESTAAIAGHTLDRSTLSLLLTLGLGVFAGALDLGVLSPALPALAHAFGVSATGMALSFTLYLLANVVSIPITAKLSDTFGRRSIYVACVGTFALGSILAITAPSYLLFLVARAVQAIGAGGIFPVATAAIADRTPVERRGAALGILGATWGLAAIIGPNLGGVLIHFVGWRAIFALNVPLALVVIVLAMRTVPSVPIRMRGRLDVAGILVLSLALVATMLALSMLDPSMRDLVVTLAGPIVGTAIVPLAIAVAIAAFALLIPIERFAASPIVSPALMANRQIATTYVLEIGIGILEGALFFVPAALVAAEGLSYAFAGAVSAIGAIVFVAVIPLAGKALDRYGSRPVLAAGALCTSAGLALIALTVRSLPLTVAGLVVAGFGFGSLLGAPTRYIISNEAPQELRASAIGLLSIFLIVGQIVGGSLAGGLVGRDVANVPGYQNAFFAFSAIALAVFAGVFCLRKARRSTAS